MMLVIHTQYRENYGTPSEPFWKMKGGYSHKILNVPVYNQTGNYRQIAEFAASKLCTNNEMAIESMEYWSLEPDTYLSEFERSQLDFDGKILFPETALEYSNLGG